ncbi:hypothetical protein FACS1894172_09260 [Spirochaetia bacterium]|nr:hypothetical protein FACS1894164_11660 [Spirochaetia bacterium]GHU32512.1 hypothetical protein FACS1894172_09260 [Spirochaetia bacterium]
MYRAKELTLQDINRVIVAIQRDIESFVPTTGTHIDDPLSANALQSITDSINRLQSLINTINDTDLPGISSLIDTKADKTNTVNGLEIQADPIIDSSLIPLGFGDDTTVYDALKQASTL